MAWHSYFIKGCIADLPINFETLNKKKKVLVRVSTSK